MTNPPGHPLGHSPAGSPAGSAGDSPGHPPGGIHGRPAGSGSGPAQRMFAADTASRALGIELLGAGDGSARLRMTVTAQMVNGHGLAHGGYIFLLADTAFACACNGHGPVTVAAGADITFIAPAHEGDVLWADARERARFGRSGLYDVSILRDGEVIAEFRGHSRSIREVRKAQ